MDLANTLETFTQKRFFMPYDLQLGAFNLDFSFNNRFSLFSFSNVFAPESYKTLQSGFTQLSWKEDKANFYEQYSYVIRPEDQTPFNFLCQPSFFSPFKANLERFLKTSLRNSLRLVAHKLIFSQGIDVHNDYCGPESGYENFRFIFQFANLSRKISGGEISFLNSENKEDVIKRYPYSENAGICFEVTPYSFHYVAPVEKGERFTLVMYLWDSRSKYDGSGIEVSV